MDDRISFGASTFWLAANEAGREPGIGEEGGSADRGSLICCQWFDRVEGGIRPQVGMATVQNAGCIAWDTRRISRFVEFGLQRSEVITLTISQNLTARSRCCN